MLLFWSILQYFWPALSDNWSWKPIFAIFESGQFRSFTVILILCLLVLTFVSTNRLDPDLTRIQKASHLILTMISPDKSCFENSVDPDKLASQSVGRMTNMKKMIFSPSAAVIIGYFCTKPSSWIYKLNIQWFCLVWFFSSQLTIWQHDQG